MPDHSNFTMHKLIKIAHAIGETYGPEQVGNTEIITISLAADIRLTIINQLKEIYAKAINLTDDDNIILFYHEFSDDDFDNLAQLETAKTHLSDLTDSIEERYLKKMWETRRNAYTKEVFTTPTSQTSNFFQTKFVPESQEELKLSQQFKLAKQIYDNADILINHLDQLNQLIFHEDLNTSHSNNTMVR